MASRTSPTSPSTTRGTTASAAACRSEPPDFESLPLEEGVALHLHRAERYKTVRLEVFLQDLLQRRRNTRLALLSRLLERGTHRLPDLRSLNRHADQLWGANLSVDIDQLGDRQVLHLVLEVLDERYVPAGEDPLEPGIVLLGEVLSDPVTQDGGFRPDYLHQEKRALRQSIAATFNDKMLYAQRRCVEEMCRGEAYGLPLLGDPADFRGISAVNLLRYHRHLLQTNPIDVFASGWFDDRRVAELTARSLAGRRRYAPIPATVPIPVAAPERPRRILERQEVSQGRLVQGYRTQTGLADPDYPALGLLNLLWGGDSQSRLFRTLREERGLCYHVGSYLEPLCGLLFVTAGVEAADFEAAIGGIADQLEALRAGRFEPGEVEAARSLLRHRLLRLEDDRAGLARLHYRQRVAASSHGRRELGRAVDAVTPEALCRVAQRVKLDTTYFLHNGQSASGRWD
ncbi:MAG: pitrilysin family protein [Candidatus Latescibacterota bacterium]